MTDILPVAHSAQLHNTLMGADDAALRYDSAGGRDVLDSALKQLFFRHGVANTFAVRLLHRHFDVEDGEKVVHCGNVAMPWNLAELSPAVRAQTVPSSFVINAAGELFPYEFTYVPGDAIPSPEPEDLLVKHAIFLRDWNVVLRDIGLVGVLGLAVIRHLTGGIGMEYTEGRANVTIPLEASDVTARDLETIWVFDPDAPQDGKARCKSRCKKTTTGHLGRHLLSKG